MIVTLTSLMQNPGNICDEVPLQNVQISEGSLCLKCHHGSSLWHMAYWLCHDNWCIIAHLDSGIPTHNNEFTC